ncbi:MAG: thioredoxin family protein, partial [Muribaculaceae bacterium]|nr:thioredoxin family protein [Muribaculaceae bacterium]
FVAERGETLVYFFDSECVTCKERIPYADEAADGRAIIAVCPQNYAGSFKEAAAMFPKHWTVVRDRGTIETDELYLLPTLPSAYIIGSDMTVLAKDLLL